MVKLISRHPIRLVCLSMPFDSVCTALIKQSIRRIHAFQPGSPITPVSIPQLIAKLPF